LPCFVLAGLALSGCGDGSPDPERLPLAATIDERFVSFAVDLDQLAGGTFWDPAGGPTTVRVPPYDFSRERIRNLARALGPAYMRLGGSASDRTYYDLSDAPSEAPPPFQLVLDRAEWDAANAFAADLGLEIVFTVAAGAGPRDGDRRWTPDNARVLLAYTKERGYPLAALEFGNEPNLFAVRAGITGYDAAAFSRDLETFRALRDDVMPGVPIFAPGNVYTRTQGEEPIPGIVFGPRATEMMPLIGSRVDGVNYHYYAAISTRCPLGPRVTADTALDPAYLDGVEEAASATEALRDEFAPGKPVWLTETGGQSCGGQIGVGDRFVNTIWWLNTLGDLARRGQRVVVRQTLSGSTYGLIDELTEEPRPDYWAALIFRRLMGTRVLRVPEEATAIPGLRIYAHCRRGGPPGAVTVLAINVDRSVTATLPLEVLGLSPPAEIYVGTAQDLAGHELLLNGETLRTARDGTPPPLAGVALEGMNLAVPPAGWIFATFATADVAACQE
jgi:hypothetical protein